MTAPTVCGLLPDHEIRRLCREARLIEPFVDHIVREGVLSYGLSSAGYDCRLGDDLLVFTNISPAVVDPKAVDERAFVRCEGSPLMIPPHSFALGVTLETFHIPADILALVVGKSTLARCGLVLHATPLEPGWYGRVTLEISNTTPLPARLYPGEGIGQVLFFRLASRPEATYADRGGLYQGQRDITLPRVAPARRAP